MRGIRRHNALTYRLEFCFIRLRDRICPPDRLLTALGVREGMTVLDYGCGPGGYSVAAARSVGPEGCVFAVDVQPLAVDTVRRAAERWNLAHLRALYAKCRDDIPSGRVDLALLYDILHIFEDRDAQLDVLKAIHRMLAPDGLLSVKDHHIDEPCLSEIITSDKFFRQAGAVSGALQFYKASGGESIS